MKKNFLTFTLLLIGMSAGAQVVADGSAPVLSAAGRTSCEYVQLWENGPKWATFNVGATITDYANLTIGADATPYLFDADQAPYYSTANVGGLYAWNNPNLNGRQTTWTSSVATGIADVATTLWGSNWETPSYMELDTLQNSRYGKTTWTWCDGTTTQYVAGCTLKGYKVSGVDAYADKSIFLPATGFFDCNFGMLRYVSSDGYYWSNTMFDLELAFYLGFDSWFRDLYNYGNRKFGRTVRAVLVEDELTTSVDNVSQEAPAEKLLYGGRILIQRGEHTYDLTGAKVK